jgi:glycerophosphoryl diester phosphodiesterase
VLDTRRKTSGKVSIVGHRGAAGCAPENTLAAFCEGLAQRADIIELDVQLSADGHVVAFHDDQLDRTTNGQGRVSEKTLAELKALDAGSWFDPRFAGEPIPTLEKVLTWAKDRVPLFVELKYAGRVDPGAALDDAVVAQIVAHAMLDQVMVISFNHRALRRVKARVPGLATGALYGLPVADPVALAREVGADAVMPLCHIVTVQDVAACHAVGLAVNVWGPFADYAALSAAGVDCVNADHPAQVRHDFFKEESPC